MGDPRKSAAYRAKGFGTYAGTNNGGFAIKVSEDGRSISVCHFSNDGQIDSVTFEVAPKEDNVISQAEFDRLFGSSPVRVLGCGGSASSPEVKARA